MSLLLKALTQLEPRPAERVDERVHVKIDLPIEKADFHGSEQFNEPEAFIAEAPAADLPFIDIEIEPIDESASTSEAFDLKTATELVFEPIDDLQKLVMDEFAEAAPTVEEPPQFADPPIESHPLAAFPTPTAPHLELSVEYQELCQHLLSRFRMEKHSTLIAIDAGQVPTDASWLFPFAAGIVQTLAALDNRAPVPPRILIVEAAGPASGVAQSLGIRSQIGLIDALTDEIKLNEAIHRTEHPQVFLLERGKARLDRNSTSSIAEFWAALLPQFDLVIVAAGPWFPQVNSTVVTASLSPSPAVLLAPLADAAILCVELNGTSQAIAAATKRQLDAAGVNVLGCVVRGDSAAA